MDRMAFVFAVFDAAVLSLPFVAAGYAVGWVRFGGLVPVAIAGLAGGPVFVLLGIRSYFHCRNEDEAFWGLRRLSWGIHHATLHFWP